MSERLAARLAAFTSHRASKEVQALMTRALETYQDITEILRDAVCFS